MALGEQTRREHRFTGNARARNTGATAPRPGFVQPVIIRSFNPVVQQTGRESRQNFRKTRGLGLFAILPPAVACQVPGAEFSSGGWPENIEGPAAERKRAAA
jgi:hypothetical protein